MNSFIAFFSQVPLLAIFLPIVLIIILFFVFRKRGQGGIGDGACHNQLYVGNLPYSLKDSELNDLFSEYGQVDSLRIIKQSRTNRSKGFGFVTFKTDKEAKNALSVHGSSLKGRTVVVRIAKQKDA